MNVCKIPVTFTADLHVNKCCNFRLLSAGEGDLQIKMEAPRSSNIRSSAPL